MIFTYLNGGKNMPDEEKKYYESEAKRRWDKENTTKVLLKLNHNTDRDLLEYLEKQKEKGCSLAGTFKEALREKINNQ